MTDVRSSQETEWSPKIQEYPGPEILYADLREKWRHEDDLVNQRVTWLLNSQIFMLTGYGLLAKLRIDASSELGDLSSLTVLAAFVLPLLAMYVLVVLGRGILAAFRAMDDLKEDLLRHQQHERLWTSHRIDVLQEATNDGAGGPRGLVYAFGAAWCVLAIFEVARLICRLAGS